MGSRLVDLLFAIEGIVRIWIRDSVITLSKNCADPWPEMAGRVVPAIRAALTGEVPAVAEEALNAIRNAPMDEVGIKVDTLFKDHINPALKSHGGYARLVRVEGRDLFVELGGGCQGCSASKATLRNGIERAIREIAPQIRDVVDVTDHAAGANPYYSE